MSRDPWRSSVELYSQNNHPWRIQGDKACKVQVHLDANKTYMLLPTGSDGAINDRQQDGRIGGSGGVVYLCAGVIVK